MKRTTQDEAFRRIFPIFQWLECDQCHAEFRLESMWQTETGPYYGSRGRLVHYCLHCAPTRDDACELKRTKQETIRSARPIAPPPPPGRKVWGNY